MTSEALRVMGFAYRPVERNLLWSDRIEEKLVFIGLSGMTDPPRKEAPEAVYLCRQAGIKTVMITGDHKETAKAIAASIGIYREGDQILTGAELDQMTDSQLEDACAKATVYARVYPRHKLRIIRAHRKRTNSGNDRRRKRCPASYDYSIAMGKTGTDVTRQSAAMILMDDNFSSIVAAVEEGRNIYSNIRKFIDIFFMQCRRSTDDVFGFVWSSDTAHASLLIVNLATMGYRR